MAAKRVLLAAEFDRGSATLTRLLPLAVALADQGLDVTLAVPPALASAAAGLNFAVRDAPRWTVPPPPGCVAVSYADLLMHGGVAAVDGLVVTICKPGGDRPPAPDQQRTIVRQRRPRHDLPTAPGSTHDRNHRP